MREHAGPIIGARKGAEVRDCEVCGWRHLDPIPDEAELALMYERAYYQSINAGWLDKDRSEKPHWDMEHADKLADWSELLGRSGAALLDVGCSGGLLLEFARDNGWTTEGIEPSPEAVVEAHSHGLTVHEGLYEDIDIADASFDVVHAKLVMEHLPRPDDFLRWAHRVLREDGLVSVQVPNDFNPLQLAAAEALGKEQWWIAPPFHINYFSFDSMELLFRACGFEPVKRDATFAMEWFLLSGEDYVGNDELGKSAHHRRMTLERRLEDTGLRRDWHQFLAERSLGREVIMHGRRVAA